MSLLRVAVKTFVFPSRVPASADLIIVTYAYTYVKCFGFVTKGLYLYYSQDLENCQI
jgi:hypothetical protein